MESALALFSQPGAFGSFVGTKEQGEVNAGIYSYQAREAGASGTALRRRTFITRRLIKKEL